MCPGRDKNKFYAVKLQKGNYSMSTYIKNLFNFSRSLPEPFDKLSSKKIKASSKYGSGTEATLCSTVIKAVHAVCRCMNGSEQGAVGVIDHRTVAEYKSSMGPDAFHLVVYNSDTGAVVASVYDKNTEVLENYTMNALYTDFLAGQTHSNYLSSYHWYPYPPTLKTAIDARNEKAFWDYVKADTKNLEMVQFVAHYIANIIEDGYIENRMLSNFPGVLGYGLEKLREKHFEQIATVTQLMEKEEDESRHIFESIFLNGAMIKNFKLNLEVIFISAGLMEGIVKSIIVFHYVRIL